MWRSLAQTRYRAGTRSLYCDCACHNALVQEYSDLSSIILHFLVRFHPASRYAYCSPTYRACSISQHTQGCGGPFAAQGYRSTVLWPINVSWIIITLFHIKRTHKLINKKVPRNIRAGIGNNAPYCAYEGICLSRINDLHRSVVLDALLNHSLKEMVTKTNFIAAQVLDGLDQRSKTLKRHIGVFKRVSSLPVGESLEGGARLPYSHTQRKESWVG